MADEAKMCGMGMQIVVIDGGFVCVGETTVCESVFGPEVLISRCKNIRQWGTKKGLGELRNGPTKQTILDDEGECIVPYARVVRMIPTHGNWYDT